MTPRLLALLDEIEAAEGKATPGPWVRDHDFLYLAGEGGEPVFTVAQFDPTTNEPLSPDGHANANLVTLLRSNAPLLIRALRVALHIVDIRDGDLTQEFEQELAAIEAELEERR